MVYDNLLGNSISFKKNVLNHYIDIFIVRKAIIILLLLLSL